MVKKKVYVADDDPAILEIVSLILKDHGYDVETSPDGNSIETITDNYPDLFLLDIRMSGKSGKDICVNLKSNANTQKIPVVLISANHDLVKIAKECGADAYLSKPFDISELITITGKYIN